ncbi:ATP-binding protein [Paracoccus sp. (in: a-proteobacteria)]|uniref:ATP-binding protein n=1 Tax=Paracoccus sp. TaxID=267 RepID=UPI0028A023C9|nr:ATP-binding protein [Paracoccus sp. (in: a-proteobacteria)]
MANPKQTAPSLRRDLALRLGLLMTLLWVLALTAGWLTMRHEVDEIYDASLKRTAERIQSLIESSPTEPPSSLIVGGGLFLQIRAPDGRVLIETDQQDDAVFAGPDNNGFGESGDARTYTRRAADGTVIRLADPLAERRTAAWDTVSAFFIAAGLMLPLNILALLWLTHSRLRPVTRFAQDVSTRDARDLEPLSTPNLPQEILPIEASVNRLMERVELALQIERSFSANAAHELRTPIAALLAQTQRLIAEAPEGPLRERATRMADEQKRLARISEKLLDLARAEGGGAPPQPFDMRAVAQLVIRDFKEVTWQPPPTGPILISMDPDGFAILLRNLLENAVLHGQPPITVTLDRDRLTVSNGGPAILPELLPTLTRRFERAGSRASGSGLGLAIVDTLVRKSGAKLELTSPLPGRTDGFAATVHFPPHASV